MTVARLLVILVLLAVTPGYAHAAGLGYLRLSLARGEVQVKTPETGEWSLAPANMPFAEGDEVWVPGGGRAELQLNSGSYIRLDENSSLQVLSLDRDASQFYIPQGRAYVYFSAPPGVILQIDTPDASTRVFSRGSFGVDVPDSFTEIAVYRGSVETENTVGKTTVVSGQVVTLGQESYGEIAPLGLANDWEDWNKTRDRRLAARKSTRYLPAELAVYAPDFDRNGRWVHAREYGYVWSPTGVAEGWSPYSDGRWLWRDGEYVWVAYEPWGWAPYHYGRWAYVSRFGWCWVPPPRDSVYWGPGYVGWVKTREYVAWVPLAPGETYYGRGYYGPHSVNVTSVNVTQININVYKNVYVNRGVKVVSRDSFSTPAPTRVNVNSTVIQRNIFTRNNMVAGAPDIKPTRASSLPSARAAAPAKQPPPRVRNLQVQEIRHKRPLVKDAARSVLAPAARPAKLPVSVVSTPRETGKRGHGPKPAAAQGKREPAAAPAVTPERREGRPAAAAPRGSATPATAPPARTAPAATRPTSPPAAARPAAPEPSPPAAEGKPAAPAGRRFGREHAPAPAPAARPESQAPSVSAAPATRPETGAKPASPTGRKADREHAVKPEPAAPGRAEPAARPGRPERPRHEREVPDLERKPMQKPERPEPAGAPRVQNPGLKNRTERAAPAGRAESGEREPGGPAKPAKERQHPRGRSETPPGQAEKPERNPHER